MGAENFVANGVNGKRVARRSRVLLAARLQTTCGDVDCRLRDLSRKGALIECATQPPVGSEVTFVRGSTVVPARVAWTAAGRIGLEFLFMIDEQEVFVQLKRKTGPVRFDGFHGKSLGKGMSDDARKLALAWGVTVGLTVPQD